MKLMSTTDFVIQQEKTFENNGQKHAFTFLSSVVNYANFLKRKLKLGMFVPCDKNDVPLEEPKEHKCEHNHKINLTNWFNKDRSLLVKDNPNCIDDKGNQCEWIGDCIYGFKESPRHRQYQEAQERVLFKNCRIHNNEKLNTSMLIINEAFNITLVYEELFTTMYKTIEDIVKLDLELTETAVKQLEV